MAPMRRSHKVRVLKKGGLSVTQIALNCSQSASVGLVQTLLVTPFHFSWKNKMFIEWPERETEDEFLPQRSGDWPGFGNEYLLRFELLAVLS